MKRVLKISSESVQSELSHLRPKPKTPFLTTINNSLIKTSINYSFILAESYSSLTNISSRPFPDIIGLFADRWSHVHVQDLVQKVSVLRDKLIQFDDSTKDEIFRVLDEKGSSWFKQYDAGAAFVELLKQLERWPSCALQVCVWRRKQSDIEFPMTPEEYVKCIRVAGRSKDIGLATELFSEAANKRIKTAAMYNALMGAYMYNEHADKCQLLFRDFKNDKSCEPTVVTYNILLSVFGRLMLIDHMEAVLQEMKTLNILPTLSTYNMLIGGYVTAWMWDSMEKTYAAMEAGGIDPNIRTRMLMLRGYAYSGNLKKMEEIYELINHHIIEQNEFTLIRAMICAYCGSTSTDRVRKVEELLKLLPKNDYKPWMNVILIKLYAQENMLDVMDSYINEAFKRKTLVTTVGIMRCIISSYFRGNVVDKLANFVKRAECAEWRICRSLYHCKMVMYSSQQRLAEMEAVLGEMGNVNIHPTKKTFCIMYEAYIAYGQKQKSNQVLGVMCTYGFGIPSDTLDS